MSNGAKEEHIGYSVTENSFIIADILYQEVTMIPKKDNLFIRVLKFLHIIQEREISKSDMCKSAQSVCNHKCSSCAWNEKESECS